METINTATERSGLATASGRGKAFRLCPLDGPAAFPRTVLIDGKAVTIPDGSWYRPGEFSQIQVQALGDVAPKLANAVTASVSAGRQPEKWCIVTSDEDCDLPTPNLRLPRRQLIYSVDNAALAVGNSFTPVIDARPFDAIRILQYGANHYGGAYVNPIEVDSSDTALPSGAFGTVQLSLTGTTNGDQLLIRTISGTSAPVTGLGAYWMVADLFQLQLVVSTSPSSAYLRIWGLRFGD